MIRPRLAMCWAEPFLGDCARSLLNRLANVNQPRYSWFPSVCPTAREVVYSCPMHITSLAGNQQPSAWTKALQLFYAGLYAFVLPFICWGA